MHITKRVTTTIVGATMAGVFTFGAVASAAGPDGGGTGTDKHPRKEFICSHQQEVADHLAKVKADVEAHITALTERRAKAEAASKTEAVARIDERLAHLNTRLDRVTKRADGLPAFIAANCTTPSTPPTTTATPPTTTATPPTTTATPPTTTATPPTMTATPPTTTGN